MCLLNIKLLLDLFVLYHLLLNLDMLFSLPNISLFYLHGCNWKQSIMAWHGHCILQVKNHVL
jgi:hypothetical protein